MATGSGPFLRPAMGYWETGGRHGEAYGNGVSLRWCALTQTASGIGAASILSVTSGIVGASVRSMTSAIGGAFPLGIASG